MTLDVRNLMKRTGATHRQIDYWCHMGVISPVGPNCPGSGRVRKFDREVVDRVILLVKVSKAFNYRLNTDQLKQIYDAYDDGFIDLGDGLKLRWK